MKKILTRTITLLVAIVLMIGAFSGCGLVVTNQDRDMKQVVASISIGNAGEGTAEIHEDSILKKELVAGYMSYGYYYVSSYGYTLSKAYSMVLERLVQSSVVVQQAKIGLAQYYIDNKDKELDGFGKDYVETMKKNASAAVKAEDIYNAGISADEYKKLSESGNYAKLAKYLEVYLSKYEIAQAKYTVLSSVASMIESYKTEDDAEENEKETISVTARTTPSSHVHEKTLESELKEEEVTEYEKKVVAATLGDGANMDEINAKTNKYDLNKYLYDNYKLDLNDSKNKAAFSKAVKQLKKNGVISESEPYDGSKQEEVFKEEVFKYSYFQYMLKSQYESLIVTKYENELKYETEKQIKSNPEALKDQFKAEYDSQYASYVSDYSAYETALDAVTEEKGVYCNPYDGYGYVLNLLIGFTDEQTAVLNEQNSKAGISNDQKLINRENMLKNLVAKDQRETWVKSSYGTYTDGKFTFDSDYLVGGNALLSSYIGQALLKESFEDKDDNGVAKTSYSFKNVYADGMNFDSFVSTYLSPLTGIEKKFFKEGDGNTIGTLDEAHGMVDGKFDNESDTRKNFDDLMFAFSTDTGCLNKTYGYLYSPKTSETQYVPEFAAAAKAVVEEGEGAYTIVATQYGYHVILCTKVIEKTSADELFDQLTDAVKGEYTDIKVESLLSDYITKISNRMVNTYIEKAKYFNKTYSDLIENDDDPAASNN